MDRRQPIFERDHAATARIGEQPAQTLMRIEIADDEAAAVEIDEHRQRLGHGVDRRVAAIGEGSRGPRPAAVLDAADRHVLGVRRLRECRYPLPCLGRAHLPDFRPAGGNQQIEEILRVRM